MAGNVTGFRKPRLPRHSILGAGSHAPRPFIDRRNLTQVIHTSALCHLPFTRLTPACAVASMCFFWWPGGTSSSFAPMPAPLPMGLILPTPRWRSLNFFTCTAMPSLSTTKPDCRRASRRFYEIGGGSQKAAFALSAGVVSAVGPFNVSWSGRPTGLADRRD